MDDAIPQKLMPNSAFNRMLVVGATDLKSANYVTFNSTLDSSKVQTGVKASATMTGLFPVVNYKDFTLIEGTIKYGVDIISAVTYCQSQGFANEDIIVDVIMATYKKLQEVDASQFSTIQSLFRYLSITSYLSVMDQVTNSQHYYPNVTLNVVTPSEDISTYLTNISPYDFSKSDIEKFFNIGYSDGKEAASDRSSVAFE